MPRHHDEPRADEPRADDSRRQSALDAYAILDTGTEQAFDDIVRLAAMICEVPAATISLIDRDRQWFKDRVGDLPPPQRRRPQICQSTLPHPKKEAIQLVT